MKNIHNAIKYFQKFAEKHEDILSGGKADCCQPSDFNKKQIEKGINVEYEHTNNADVAKEIAMDHLKEIEDYYDRLESMENQAKEEGALNE